MFTKQTIFGAMTIVSIFCGISSYPTIPTDLNNLQSIDDLSDKKRPMPDVADTIEQVRKMLQDDPTLPRLTKGEIEDLFEQVAKEEYEKSLQQGDVQRATNMRALMLVLPYNSENTTDEALQELYTRPPITKLIDSYSVPRPQKFQTVAPTVDKVEVVQVGDLPPTTYKPFFRQKDKSNAKPTTYHPLKPLPKLPKEPTTSQVPFSVPVTSLPLLPDIEEEENKATRYSSSYSAKNADWSLLEGEFNNGIQFHKKFTPMPGLPSIFKSIGMSDPPKQLKLQANRQSTRPLISSSISQTGLGAIDLADFTRALPPRPKVQAYSEFKPLNIGEEIRIKPDIEDYLNRFGIINRKRKQIKPEDSGDVTRPLLPTHQPAKEQPIRRSDTNIDDASLKSLNEEVELAQLSKLLNNLQELERLNVSLTPDMIKQPKTNNLKLTNGPDPVTSDANLRKNDLKRQSETESTTESSKVDSESDDSDTDATTTAPAKEDEPAKESSNGSLSDLEDSFGGPDPITEDPSPPPKKNGFYFLADWNSFLEVGEAGNDQVVVRFDKKVGDPRRFLKVTVP